jgi:predicted HicB family RNase H-like nuclease
MSKISVRISPEEKELIWKYAKENDLSLSQVIRRAIKLLLSSS